jgi:hypothetical protein
MSEKKKGVLDKILDPDEPLLYHLTAIEKVTDASFVQHKVVVTFHHRLEVGRSGAIHETATALTVSSKLPIIYHGRGKKVRTPMLEGEYAFFKGIRNRLILEHPGEFVVIKGETILGYYASDVEALRATLKEHAPGSFIVQKCVSEDEEVQNFHSRAIFA